MSSLEVVPVHQHVVSSPEPLFYTPAEVAQILKISTDSVLRKFARVNGVIDVGTEENLRKHTRRRRMLRIPHDVLQRFIQSSRVQ